MKSQPVVKEKILEIARNSDVMDAGHAMTIASAEGRTIASYLLSKQQIL
jgi:hypothetical protein